MRYFYQQMLAFILIILVIVSTLGLTLFNFSKEQLYLRQEEQLSQVAEYIAGQEITADYLEQIQPVLDSANMRVYYYDEDNQRRYPKILEPSKTQTALTQTEQNQLKNGQRIGVRAYDMGFSDSDSDSLSIFIPLEMKDNSSYGGYLVIGAPSELTDQAIKALYFSVSRGVVISSIIAGLLAAVLARYQNRRISRLSQATKQIASGDYSIAVPTHQNDEFDDLAKDFNQMTAALQESQKEINRQENMRRQLMMDVAHEMRTPLTTMTGLLKGMKDRVLPVEKWSRSIDLVYGETQRLSRLVNENLDYEKIRANEVVLNKVKFKIAPILEDIAIQLRTEAHNKATDIVVVCEDNICVYADNDRFRQIIVNIVKNAVQFTDNGIVTIRSEERLEFTRIQITDSGIGMTKEQVENVWERFYKADISRKNNTFGESGLGLSIVKQLMNSHNGTINVESESGIGTVFTLDFPNDYE